VNPPKAHWKFQDPNNLVQIALAGQMRSSIHPHQGIARSRTKSELENQLNLRILYNSTAVESSTWENSSMCFVF